MKALAEVWPEVVAAFLDHPVPETSRARSLIQDLLTERDQEITRLMQFGEAQTEALGSAGVEEDRQRVHIAGLAEALAAIGAEEQSVETLRLNRARLESARGICQAFREFVEGFDARLAAVQSSMDGG